MSKLKIIGIVILTGGIISLATLFYSRPDTAQLVGCLPPGYGKDGALIRGNTAYRSISGLPFWFRVDSGPSDASGQNCFPGTVSGPVAQSYSSSLHNKYRTGYFVLDDIFWGIITIGIAGSVTMGLGRRHG